MDTEEAAVANRTETNNNPEEARRQRDVRLRMDIDDSDIVVAGANPTRISRKQVNIIFFVIHFSYYVSHAILGVRIMRSDSYYATLSGGQKSSFATDWIGAWTSRTVSTTLLVLPSVLLRPPITPDPAT